MPQKINPKDLEPILRTQIGPEIGPRAVQAFTNQGFHGTIGPYSPQEVLMDRVRNSFAGHLADKLVGLFGTPEELLGNVGTSPVSLAGDVTSLFGKKSLFDMRGKMTDFGKIAMKYKDLLNEHFGGTLPNEIIGKLREHANVLSSLAPEELKQLGVSSELHGAANEYSNWLKKRENLRNLGLPHPTLEYFAKKAPNKNVFDELDDIVPKLDKSLEGLGFVTEEEKEKAKGIIRTNPNWHTKLMTNDPELIKHGNKYAELNSLGNQELNKKADPLSDQILGKVLNFFNPKE